MSSSTQEPPPSPRGPFSVVGSNRSIPTTRQTRNRSSPQPNNNDTRNDDLRNQTQQLYLENRRLMRILSERKNFSNNRLNSMSYKYLHINTQHLPRGDNQTEYSINLIEPIRNASALELTSFSIANDFYNVLNGNNQVRIIFKRNPDTGTTALNDVYTVAISLEQGFYTHQEMIEEIIRQLTLTSNLYYDSSTQTVDADGFYDIYPSVLAVGSSVFVQQTTYAVKIKITQETSGKTTFEFKQNTSVASGLKYALLSYPYEDYDTLFHDSILHRLGYTKQQVYFSDKTITDSTQVFLSNTTSNNRIDLTNQRIVLENIIFNDVAVSSTELTAFSRNFSNSTRQKYTSNKLAWETHSHLHVTCDLIHDIQTTTQYYKQLGKTQLDDTLASVSIDTNRASWIHYIPQSLTHLHKIDNPLIRNFKIGIKNAHSHTHFTGEQHKDFQLTLKIHLMDDETIPNKQFFDSISNGSQYFSYE